MTGQNLPKLKTKIPGPKSRHLTRELRDFECPNITGISKDAPIFWDQARGANVQDVDGNQYIDLTSGFGVTNVGHGNIRVQQALMHQAKKLLHSLGDVHPAQVKVELLKTLSKITPKPLEQTLLATSGSEAVEIAIKTALLATGKPGIIAFEGAYHGLTYGVLPATDLFDLRNPFQSQLGTHIIHVPFPSPNSDRTTPKEILKKIETALRNQPIGAVLIEPIQGRGGIRIAPVSFMRHLRQICNDMHALLMIDEIYSGFGRTGKLFCFEHSRIVPDIITVGKGLSGGFPISACIGTRSVMSAWPRHHTEALHTSTFLGNPIGCAMALASIHEIQTKKLIQRAKKLGDFFIQKLRQWRHPMIRDIRGLGLMIGIEMTTAQKAQQISIQCLKRGIILLTDGINQNVLSLTPPLVITQKQIEYAVKVIHEETNRQ